MLDKLLSNLPYNPGLIHQLSFYGKRMREEASVRRLGLVFIVLAFMVQFVAVLSPVQPTAADPSNDLIPNGTNKALAVSYCQNNTKNYGDILHNYGITCNDVSNSTVVPLKSTDYNKTLYSMGRIPYGKVGETTAQIPLTGSTTPKSFYWRYLWSWDTGAFSTYTALKLTVTNSGVTKTYFILYSCGNLVSIGLPTAIVVPKPIPTTTPTTTPVTPTPKPTPTPTAPGLPCAAAQSTSDVISCLSLSKKAANVTENVADANNTTAQPGDLIRYTLSVTNTGTATAPQFVIQENMSDVLLYADITDFGGGTINSDHILLWPAQDIAAGATVSEQFSVQVKNPLPTNAPSASNPGDYDHVMSNVYNNTVNIKLPQPTIVTVAKTVQPLPNTGPGSSIAIGFGLTLIIGYFFARSRLLSKESLMAVHDSAGGEV